MIVIQGKMVDGQGWNGNTDVKHEPKRLRMNCFTEQRNHNVHREYGAKSKIV